MSDSATPRTAACQAPLSSTVSQTLLNFMSIELVMLTIPSSAAPFSSCVQSFPASGSFPVSQLFASGGQSTGVFSFSIRHRRSIVERTSEVAQLCPALCDPMDCRFLHPPIRLLHPWNFPGRSTGVGCHFLLQGIFPTQGSNPGLLLCRQMLYHLSHILVKQLSLNCHSFIKQSAMIFTPFYFLFFWTVC